MTSTEIPSARVRDWQVALVTVGILILGLGAIVLVNDVPPTQYLPIAVWLLGALVIHDGVIAFTVFGASVLLRKITRTVPYVAVVVVQGALVIAGVMTIVVVPEIVKRAIGTANPTILPLDYLANLLDFYVVLAGATVVAVAVCLIVVRLRRSPDSR